MPFPTAELGHSLNIALLLYLFQCACVSFLHLVSCFSHFSFTYIYIYNYGPPSGLDYNNIRRTVVPFLTGRSLEWSRFQLLKYYYYIYVPCLFMCMSVCICMVYRNYHFCVFYIHHTTSLDIKACVFSSYIPYFCQFFKKFNRNFLFNLSNLFIILHFSKYLSSSTLIIVV